MNVRLITNYDRRATSDARRTTNDIEKNGDRQ
jgi:hypothetical protein